MTMQLERSYRPRPARSAVPLPADRSIGASTGLTDQPRGASPHHRPPVGAPERFRPRVPNRHRPASGQLSTPLVAAPGRSNCTRAEREASGYRIGRWARLSITVTVLVVGLLFATGALPVGAGGDPAAITHVVVHPGDTLWSIAGRTVPNGETGAVVERIRQLNGLDELGPAAALPVGLELVVPTG